jgi:hypothetical protein
MTIRCNTCNRSTRPDTCSALSLEARCGRDYLNLLRRSHLFAFGCRSRSFAVVMEPADMIEFEVLDGGA